MQVLSLLYLVLIQRTLFQKPIVIRYANIAFTVPCLDPKNVIPEAYSYQVCKFCLTVPFLDSKRVVIITKS